MSTRLVTMSQLASRWNRVNNKSSPINPSAINRFDGTAK
jgi:hypothetical protein